MVYLDARWIIVDFLRVRVDDPRSTKEAKVIATQTATAAQTTFDYAADSGKVALYVDTVEIDSVTKVKWRDFYVDFYNEQIIFYDALTGGEDVDIHIQQADRNFIFPGRTNKKLGEDQWPRISVKTLGSPGVRLGNFEAPIQSTLRVRATAWTKEKEENQMFEIGNRNFAGADLANYLATQVWNALDNYENDLYPALYNYIGIDGPKDEDFDKNMQAYPNQVDFIVYGLSINNA